MLTEALSRALHDQSMFFFITSQAVSLHSVQLGPENITAIAWSPMSRQRSQPITGVHAVDEGAVEHVIDVDCARHSPVEGGVGVLGRDGSKATSCGASTGSRW